MRKHTLTRRQRLLRDTLLLLLSLFMLGVLYAAAGQPLPTAASALRVLERRHLFGPGEVLAQADLQYPDRRSFALRWGDQLARAELRPRYLFWWPLWEPNRFLTVPSDPEAPLTAIAEESTFFLSMPQDVWVISSDPRIASVTLEVPFSPNADQGETQLAVFTQDLSENGCFLVHCAPPDYSSYSYSRNWRLSGYDAHGALVWQSPLPEDWVERFGISPERDKILSDPSPEIP